MRQLQEAGAGGRRRGRSMAKQRLVDGDPAADLAAASILEWVKEVQAMRRHEPGALPLKDLAMYWQAAKTRKVTRWVDTRGPADVIRLSLLRWGWAWPTPWSFVNEQGVELDIMVAFPALVQWHLRQTCRRQLEEQVSKAMAKRGWTEAGQALSSAVVRRILAERRHDAGRKGIAQSLAMGSWWTTSRWHRAGYQVDNR